jgi:CheY-like chemotaxis protein
LTATHRIVIAEPDDACRDDYLQSFGRDAYDIVATADGRDALTSALVRRPALVLTELSLPSIDGISLCEILRRDRSTNNVPILVVTSQAKQAELERAKSAGATAILRKPVTGRMVVLEAARLLASTQALKGQVEKLARDARGYTEKSRELTRRTKSIARQGGRHKTISPPYEVLALHCPSCARPLRYQESYVGGTTVIEQWDYFACQTCSARFQYRQRTRRLRQVA